MSSMSRSPLDSPPSAISAPLLKLRWQSFWKKTRPLSRIPLEWVGAGGVLLLFALPFAVAIAQLVSEVEAGITFAQRQRQGLEYSRELKALLAEMLEYRRLVNTELTDYPVSEAQFAAQRQQVDAQIRVLDSLDQRLGRTFQTLSSWPSLRSRWQQLARLPLDERLLAPSIHNQLTPPEELTRQTVALMRHVGEVSNLTADPERANYYLVNTLVDHLPMAIHYVAQAEEAGMKTAAEGRKTPEQQGQLISLSTLAKQIMENSRRDIQQAIVLEPELQALNSSERRSFAATLLFYDTFDRLLIRTETVNFSPALYGAETARTLDAQLALYDALVPTLDRRLQDRIQQLSQRRLWVLGFGSGILGMSAIATLAFVRNLRRRRQAETSLRQAHEEISQLNQQLQSENLRMGAELAVARQLQQMILPKEQELQAVPELEVSGYMSPAAEVGGDYYDVLHQDGRIKIGIGDVTGHGLESGMVMLMAQTAVRTLLHCNETNPARILDVINRTLYHNIRRMDSGNNMTLSLLDYEQGRLRFYGQHEMLIRVQADGTLDLIDTIDLGFPVALTEEIAAFVGTHEMQLAPGDVVVLYTDGITEAENTRRELYGIERLCEVIQKYRHHSADEIQQHIIADVQQHIGEQRVFDDITLVILKQK